MKARFSRLAIFLALFTGALFAPLAQAASVQVGLNTSNAIGTNPTGVDFLVVTVSDALDGAIDFSVEVNPALDLKGNGDPGIQAFSFNFGDLGITEDNLVLPDGWSVKNGGGRHSNFGEFDIQIFGTGNTRQNPLAFSVQGISGDTIDDYVTFLSRNGQQASLFAAHVPGLHVTGSGGAHFGGTSVVPVPAAVWLMLSALGLLAIRARAQKSSAPVQRRTTAPSGRSSSLIRILGTSGWQWDWQRSDAI